MKSILKTLLLLALILVLTTSMMPDQKNRIIGDYHLAKALTDGKPNPAEMMDRTMSYFENNQFMGDISFPNGKNFPFIQGVYTVQNDSIVVLHHTYNGKLHDVAWVYNYHFLGDTLWVRGFFTQAIPVAQNILIKQYIDEK